jgi:hypothetical protein
MTTGSLDPKLAPIIAALYDAFPDGPAPPIEQTSRWWIEEVDDAVAKVNGFTWRTAPPDVLDALYDARPWFTSAVFVYWLPAFLVDIAVDERRPDFRGDTVIYTLTREGPEDRAELARRRPQRQNETDAQYAAEIQDMLDSYQERFREHWNYMTPAQRAAVRMTLRYLDERYPGDADFQKALSRWPTTNDALP